MTEPDLRLRAVVPAPPKVVYEALTDPAALRVWLAEHADVDLPGTYEFWGRFTPDGAAAAPARAARGRAHHPVRLDRRRVSSPRCSSSWPRTRAARW